jgi:hypothetical protein
MGAVGIVLKTIDCAAAFRYARSVLVWYSRLELQACLFQNPSVMFISGITKGNTLNIKPLYFAVDVKQLLWCGPCCPARRATMRMVGVPFFS